MSHLLKKFYFANLYVFLQFEQRATINRFQGSNSISSDDYFNRNQERSRTSNISNSVSGANLYEIKEGVREGVSKVAGRLSNLATDVMSSLQDKYGY